MLLTYSKEEHSTYFSEISTPYHAENGLLKKITQQLRMKKAFVSNKDMIMELIDRLETEQDVAQKDILRNALELLIQKTPDDL